MKKIDPYDRSLEERLTAMFQYYDPENLHKIPELIEQYEGREVELIKYLTTNFGPEPEIESKDFKLRVKMNKIK